MYGNRGIGQGLASGGGSGGFGEGLGGGGGERSQRGTKTNAIPLGVRSFARNAGEYTMKVRSALVILVEEARVMTIVCADDIDSLPPAGSSQRTQPNDHQSTTNNNALPRPPADPMGGVDLANLVMTDLSRHHNQGESSFSGARQRQDHLFHDRF